MIFLVCSVFQSSKAFSPGKGFSSRRKASPWGGGKLSAKLTDVGCIGRQNKHNSSILRYKQTTLLRCMDISFLLRNKDTKEGDSRRSIFFEPQLPKKVRTSKKTENFLADTNRIHSFCHMLLKFYILSFILALLRFG